MRAVAEMSRVRFPDYVIGIFHRQKSSRSNISDVDNSPHHRASRVVMVERPVDISYHAALRDYTFMSTDVPPKY